MAQIGGSVKCPLCKKIILNEVIAYHLISKHHKSKAEAVKILEGIKR